MSADGTGYRNSMMPKRKQVLNYAGGPGNFLNNPYLEKDNSLNDDVEMK